MWFIESAALSLPVGLQIRSFCRRSRPREGSLGTTFTQMQVRGMKTPGHQPTEDLSQDRG